MAQIRCQHTACLQQSPRCTRNSDPCPLRTFPTLGTPFSLAVPFLSRESSQWPRAHQHITPSAPPSVLVGLKAVWLGWSP